MDRSARLAAAKRRAEARMARRGSYEEDNTFGRLISGARRDAGLERRMVRRGSLEGSRRGSFEGAGRQESLVEDDNDDHNPRNPRRGSLARRTSSFEYDEDRRGGLARRTSSFEYNEDRRGGFARRTSSFEDDEDRRGGFARRTSSFEDDGGLPMPPPRAARRQEPRAKQRSSYGAPDAGRDALLHRTARHLFNEAVTGARFPEAGRRAGVAPPSPPQQRHRLNAGRSLLQRHLA